ncbi:uncharacterized protein LOC124272163 [Haliotis rubra]|uniref:uncharacterized protein LOC124272163 n=1 Tax=Haliotis rubra TaxID=36100 RepID=UPI001EE50118|nr:uncharacterized protein LOC124272163 [Haliotis rubra]
MLSGIIGKGTAYDVQKQFAANVNDAIASPVDLPTAIKCYQDTLQDGVKSTTCSAWGCTGPLSDMQLRIHKVVGYNNEIIIATSDQKLGVNPDINGFFSVVLMALVDGNYKFRWVDVGAYGSMSDAQKFNECELKDCLEDWSMGCPDPFPLPQDDERMPCYILGDDAFGIRAFFMKPYGHRTLQRDERIYNYRVSRDRRVVENTFGIMAQIQLENPPPHHAANAFRCEGHH